MNSEVNKTFLIFYLYLFLLSLFNHFSVMKKLLLNFIKQPVQTSINHQSAVFHVPITLLHLYSWQAAVMKSALINFAIITVSNMLPENWMFTLSLCHIAVARAFAKNHLQQVPITTSESYFEKKRIWTSETYFHNNFLVTITKNCYYIKNKVQHQILMHQKALGKTTHLAEH